MIRTAMRPKWLALLALALTVVTAFGWLGLWQLDVAQHARERKAVETVEQAPEAPIDEVMPPQTSITGHHVGRAVRATGHYDAAHQVLVVDRRLGDRLGSWVLVPLVVDSTGARLAVVRGFVDTGVEAPPVPTGTVTVHGTLQPQEGPPETFEPQRSGHVQTVDLASGVNTWGGDVYNAFVFAAAEEPPATGASAQVTTIPPPATVQEGINWRNAAYAVQWWIFAAFVLYVWWRAVRDEHELRVAAGSTPTDDAAGDTAAPVSSDDADPPTDGSAPAPLPSSSTPGGTPR